MQNLTEASTVRDLIERIEEDTDVLLARIDRRLARFDLLLASPLRRWWVRSANP